MKIKKYIFMNMDFFIFIAISAYALYLRIVSLSTRELAGDELFQVEQMKDGFLSLLKNLPALERSTILSGDHYLIYPFFKLFSFNKWGLAFPHIVITILGFYLLYLICKKYFVTIWGYLITFSIVCFNATLISHATEIRPYAVLPTLALASFYLFQQFLEQNTNMNVRRKGLLALFFIFVIWFHTFNIFFLFPIIIFCLLTKLGDQSFKINFKSTIKFLLVILCIAMPVWYLSIKCSKSGFPYPYNLDVFQFIPNPLKNISGFFKGIFCNLVGYKKLYFLLIGVLMPIFIPHKNRFQQIIFLIVVVFLPIGLVLLGDVIARYWFIQRQFIYVMPFFAFFLGWSWESFLCYLKEQIGLAWNKGSKK